MISVTKNRTSYIFRFERYDNFVVHNSCQKLERIKKWNAYSCNNMNAYSIPNIKHAYTQIKLKKNTYGSTAYNHQ
jgi:hypothetical protein